MLSKQESKNSGYTEMSLHLFLRDYRKERDKNVILDLVNKDNINCIDKKGNNPLFYAIANIRVDKEIIELLLRQGADVRNANVEGVTALHSAIERLRGKDVIELLIHYGADLSARTHGINKNTPLHYAATLGQIGYVKILLKHGVEIDAVNGIGRTALFCSAIASQNETLELLLDKGADVNKGDNIGETPLHYAIKKAAIKNVVSLLKGGANLSQADNKGITPLELSYRCRNKSIVSLITDAKNQIAPQEKAKKTLFQFWNEVDYWHKMDEHDNKQPPLPSRDRLFKTQHKNNKTDKQQQWTNHSQKTEFNIIFTDSHYEPAVYRIMGKLAPKLRELGCLCFFGEAPEGKTAEDFIAHDQRNVVDYLVESLPKKWLASKDETSILSWEQAPSWEYSKYIAGFEKIRFLQALPDLDIGFHAIDLKEVADDSRDYFTSEVGIKRRDKKMASAYLSANYPVFGLIGYKHALGMQHEILTKMPLKKALNKFYFIHIHSRPPMCQYEEDLRAGKINYPLGITVINANEINEEEIVKLISDKISCNSNKSLSDEPINTESINGPMKISIF